MTLPRSVPSRLRCWRLATACLLAVGLTLPARAQAPARLADAEFWDFFTRMSEPDGYFLSDNFVSNEMRFQDVIPPLQHSLTPGSVYLGVGPEQNFTYIANLRPPIAIILDIRRQNAMQHLMYKALFELSSSRAEFVARLFSRPSVRRLPPDIAVKALFDSADAADRDSAAYLTNRRAIFDVLKGRHRFALSHDDSLSIEQVYRVFFTAGPGINYGYRPGMSEVFRVTYPTYGMLQGATNADSVSMAFLATEANYHVVRDMQSRNLIVPVVGDFGGPTAIRAIGEYLRKRRLTVGAFYVSNVEQYLFRDGDAWERFYGNVSALPLDSTSSFIRSVPRAGGGNVMTFSAGTGRNTQFQPGIAYVVYRDSMGIRSITVAQDSAGRIGSQTVRDSAGRPGSAPNDTSLAAQLRSMLARRDSISRGQWLTAGSSPGVAMGGLLSSGLASMTQTLERFFAGDLKTYGSVIEMTRTAPWP